MNILKKSALWVFCFVYALVFAEYFLRLFKPQALIPRYVTASDYGIRVNVPNASYRHWTPEINVQMNINSLGMRAEQEYSQEKNPDVCRIGIFGDSFFMSYEVSYEDSFARQIEKYIENNSEYRCEVLNFAVSGFGTAESLLQYRYFAARYHLDFAVLEWHLTDVQDNIRSSLFAVEDGQLVSINKSYLPAIAVRDKLMQYAIYRWAIEYSHLYSAVRSELALKIKDILLETRNVLNSDKREPKKTDMSSSNNLNKKVESLDTKPLVTLDSLLIDMFVYEASKDGVETLLLDVPSMSFNGRLNSSFRRLKGQVRSDVDMVTPIDKLKILNTEGHKLYFEKGHKHFTPVGYKALAESAAERIINKLNTNQP